MVKFEAYQKPISPSGTSLFIIYLLYTALSVTYAYNQEMGTKTPSSDNSIFAAIIILSIPFIFWPLVGDDEFAKEYIPEGVRPGIEDNAFTKFFKKFISGYFVAVMFPFLKLKSYVWGDKSNPDLAKYKYKEYFNYMVVPFIGFIILIAAIAIAVYFNENVINATNSAGIYYMNPSQRTIYQVIFSLLLFSIFFSLIPFKMAEALDKTWNYYLMFFFSVVNLIIINNQLNREDTYRQNVLTAVYVITIVMLLYSVYNLIFLSSESKDYRILTLGKLSDEDRININPELYGVYDAIRLIKDDKTNQYFDGVYFNAEKAKGKINMDPSVMDSLGGNTKNSFNTMLKSIDQNFIDIYQARMSWEKSLKKYFKAKDENRKDVIDGFFESSDYAKLTNTPIQSLSAAAKEFRQKWVQSRSRNQLPDPSASQKVFGAAITAIGGNITMGMTSALVLKNISLEVDAGIAIIFNRYMFNKLAAAFSNVTEFMSQFRIYEVENSYERRSLFDKPFSGGQGKDITTLNNMKEFYANFNQMLDNLVTARINMNGPFNKNLNLFQAALNTFKNTDSFDQDQILDNVIYNYYSDLRYRISILIAIFNYHVASNGKALVPDVKMRIFNKYRRQINMLYQISREATKMIYNKYGNNDVQRDNRFLSNIQFSLQNDLLGGADLSPNGGNISPQFLATGNGGGVNLSLTSGNRQPSYKVIKPINNTTENLPNVETVTFQTRDRQNLLTLPEMLFDKDLINPNLETINENERFKNAYENVLIVYGQLVMTIFTQLIDRQNGLGAAAITIENKNPRDAEIKTLYDRFRYISRATAGITRNPGDIDADTRILNTYREEKQNLQNLVNYNNLTPANQDAEINKINGIQIPLNDPDITNYYNDLVVRQREYTDALGRTRGPDYENNVNILQSIDRIRVLLLNASRDLQTIEADIEYFIDTDGVNQGRKNKVQGVYRNLQENLINEYNRLRGYYARLGVVYANVQRYYDNFILEYNAFDPVLNDNIGEINGILDDVGRADGAGGVNLGGTDATDIRNSNNNIVRDIRQFNTYFTNNPVPNVTDNADNEFAILRDAYRDTVTNIRNRIDQRIRDLSGSEEETYVDGPTYPLINNQPVIAQNGTIARYNVFLNNPRTRDNFLRDYGQFTELINQFDNEYNRRKGSSNILPSYLGTSDKIDSDVKFFQNMAVFPSGDLTLAAIKEEVFYEFNNRTQPDKLNIDKDFITTMKDMISQMAKYERSSTYSSLSLKQKNTIAKTDRFKKIYKFYFPANQVKSGQDVDTLYDKFRQIHGSYLIAMRDYLLTSGESKRNIASTTLEKKKEIEIINQGFPEVITRDYPNLFEKGKLATEIEYGQLEAPGYQEYYNNLTSDKELTKRVTLENVTRTKKLQEDIKKEILTVNNEKRLIFANIVTNLLEGKDSPINLGGKTILKITFPRKKAEIGNFEGVTDKLIGKVYNAFTKLMLRIVQFSNNFADIDNYTQRQGNLFSAVPLLTFLISNLYMLSFENRVRDILRYDEGGGGPPVNDPVDGNINTAAYQKLFGITGINAGQQIAANDLTTNDVLSNNDGTAVTTTTSANDFFTQINNTVFSLADYKANTENINNGLKEIEKNLYSNLSEFIFEITSDDTITTNGSTVRKSIQNVLNNSTRQNNIYYYMLLRAAKEGINNQPTQIGVIRPDYPTVFNALKGDLNKDELIKILETDFDRLMAMEENKNYPQQTLIDTVINNPIINSMKVISSA